MDWNFITQRLAVGGSIRTEDDAWELVSHQITHVLSLECERDESALIGASVKYLRLGLPDDGSARPVEWFRDGIAFGLAALGVPKHRLYVHCTMGRQRGPSMAYAILRAFGMSPRIALRLLEEGRPSCVGYIGYRPDADRALKELGYEAPNEVYLPSMGST